MNNIYRHAYLTIIAERAKDASEGFLKPKSPSLPGLGKIFKIPYPNPNAKDIPYKPNHGTLCLRMLEDYQYNAQYEAINTRGWTFEERILSRRRLLYSTKQLRWQCGKAQHSNAGAAEERFNEVAMKPMSEILRPAKAAGAKRPEDPLSHMGKQWSVVINEYTDRNLTMPGDKLLAVGGLATEFNHAFGDQYIAGMWKSQLFKSLQWNSAPSPPELVKPRPKGYRAPSWSWAATDNRVLFSAYNNASGTTGKEVMKLLDFGVTLASKVAPFGQVTAGFIKVRGTLKQVAWAYDRTMRQYVVFDVDDDVGYDNLGWAHPDSREDAALKEVWALPILEELGSNGPTGMLLMPVEGKKGYWRRVGYFLLWEKRDREWLYDETDEVVTLHII